jgi:hypothetical protein
MLAKCFFSTHFSCKRLIYWFFCCSIFSRNSSAVFAATEKTNDPDFGVPVQKKCPFTSATTSSLVALTWSAVSSPAVLSASVMRRDSFFVILASYQSSLCCQITVASAFVSRGETTKPCRRLSLRTIRSPAGTQSQIIRRALLAQLQKDRLPRPCVAAVPETPARAASWRGTGLESVSTPAPA